MSQSYDMHIYVFWLHDMIQFLNHSNYSNSIQFNSFNDSISIQSQTAKPLEHMAAPNCLTMFTLDNFHRSTNNNWSIRLIVRLIACWGCDCNGERFWGAHLTYSRKRTCEDAVPWHGLAALTLMIVLIWLLITWDNLRQLEIRYIEDDIMISLIHAFNIWGLGCWGAGLVFTDDGWCWWRIPWYYSMTPW